MRFPVGVCVFALLLLTGRPVNGQPAGAKQATGKVTAISASSMTIESGTGAAKTTKTFVLDSKTEVIARGATRATKGQEHGSATSLIANGDSVTVSYDETGSTMHAAQVRVTAKAKKQ